MSSPSDTELEDQLLAAGNTLLDPPSSDEDLLSLLDQVESSLSRVEQSPTKSMQNALSPSLRALVANKLLEHPNTDVKVAVASCISEITRITAPDAPYDDEEMKEVFKVIVSSFESLSDKSSRSYNKSASILETVSKVRSCVVMLDLECDALILEMFEHFFKAIRDYHPDNVFSSMETIMTLVLEESEDISQDLLSPILASVKNDKEIPPITRKLGEKVLESSATKVKPYLIQTVTFLGIPLKDYSQVVASICDQETSISVEQSDERATTGQKAEDSKLEMASLDNGVPKDKEIANEEASPEHVDPDIKKCPKSVTSSGITQTGEDDSNSKNLEESSKKDEDDHHADQSKISNVLSKPELDSVTEKAECRLEQTANTRGRVPSSLKSESSNGSHAESKKETEELLDSHKANNKDDAISPCEEPSIEAAAPLDNVEGVKPSSEASIPSDIVTDKFSVDEAAPSYPIKETKTLEIEPEKVASPPPTEAIPEIGRARKVGRPKKKENSTKDTASIADGVSNKASEETGDQAVQPAKHSGKKHATKVSNKDTNATIVISKKESAAVSGLKAPKQSNKKVLTSGDNGDGSSSRNPVDDKKQGHTKSVIEKNVTETSDKDDKEVFSSPKSNKKSTKDEDQLEETPQTNSKRKRPPVAENASGGGEDLVGSKIKVWWPKDKRFYEGVVDAYDSDKKRHKVLYIDGDEELLNLEKQKWLVVACDPKSDEGEGAGESSPDASPDIPQKKKSKAIFPDQSAKPGNSSSKSDGGNSSNKSKGLAMKPGRKPGAESKSKGDLLKRSDDDSAGKSKVPITKSGSKSVSPAKAPNKSKDDETTPKSSTKTKQDIMKTNKPKQDTPNKSNKSKGGSKSSANGSKKVKPHSSKEKEDEDAEDASSDSEAPLSVQLKLVVASKAKGSETKTGKKRQRSARS